MNGEQMAMLRVEGKGNVYYRSKKFNLDEVNERRAWMRRALLGTRFQNSSNDQLDSMRMWQEPVSGGLFVEDGNGYEFFVPESQVSKKIAAFRQERARIPKEYENKSGKDFKWDIYGDDVTEAKNTVGQYVVRYVEFQSKGMGLYIYSTERGSGKTMLSCCILNEISRRYIGSVKFVNVMDFLEMTKKGFNYDDPEIEALYICKTLVMDDIGTQLDKAWVNTVLYRLINDRYNNHRVTIYTSNIEVKDLKMDSRIIDRIDSMSFMVHLPEVPVRRMLSEERKEKMLKENAP